MTIKELWYTDAPDEIVTALRKLDKQSEKIVEEIDYLAYAMANAKGNTEYCNGRDRGNLYGYMRALYHVGLLTREERVALEGYACGKIYNYYKAMRGI